MPIHDWTRVTPGIFHHFHHEWISTIARALNGGLLPPGYYALAEQVAAGVGPDVLALDLDPLPPSSPTRRASSAQANGSGLAVATRPPKVRFHAATEETFPTRKAKSVAVRHSSDHRVVAMVELVSPGNKASRYAIDTFANKVKDLLHAGVHLLIVDLFPPGPRDPAGIHRVIWEEGSQGDFALPADEPLTCVSYVGGLGPEIFLEPVAVGRPLPEMPLFLSIGSYVPVPLDDTYRAAFEAVPTVWQDVLAPPSER